MASPRRTLAHFRGSAVSIADLIRLGFRAIVPRFVEVPFSRQAFTPDLQLGRCHGVVIEDKAFRVV
jgi:hypothetical protein